MFSLKRKKNKRKKDTKQKHEISPPTNHKSKTSRKKTNRIKKNQMKYVVQKIPLNSFCISHLFLGIRPTLECGQHNQQYSIGENWFSLWQQAPTMPSQCWDPIRLEPVQVLCVLPQYFEFICASVLLCLEYTVSLVSSVTSNFYNLSIPFSA